jgi:hypothetical protein
MGSPLVLLTGSRNIFYALSTLFPQQKDVIFFFFFNFKKLEPSFNLARSGLFF